MCTRVRAQTLQHERQGRTLAQLTIKPAMLVSSVQAVVACYVTALRVSTLASAFQYFKACIRFQNYWNCDITGFMNELSSTS